MPEQSFQLPSFPKEYSLRAVKQLGKPSQSAASGGTTGVYFKASPLDQTIRCRPSRCHPEDGSVCIRQFTTAVSACTKCHRRPALCTGKAGMAFQLPVLSQPAGAGGAAVHQRAVHERFLSVVAAVLELCGHRAQFLVAPPSSSGDICSGSVRPRCMFN